MKYTLAVSNGDEAVLRQVRRWLSAELGYTEDENNPNYTRITVTHGISSVFVDIYPRKGTRPGGIKVGGKPSPLSVRMNKLKTNVLAGKEPVGVLSPATQLQALFRTADLTSVELEFKRALEQVDSDPPASVTAASAILEALFCVILEEAHGDSPKKKTISELFKRVRKEFLNFDGAGDDLTKFMGGLTTVVQSIGAFRTHVGSAHGRGEKGVFPVKPRHAKFAVNAAHSVVLFLYEEWRHRSAEPAART